MQAEARGTRRRIGPWRLLDLMQATMPWRNALFCAAALLPEFGPPDAPAGPEEPACELPGSNIGESERRQAIQREVTRRLIAARR